MLSTFCFCEVQNFTTHPIFLPNKTLISQHLRSLSSHLTLSRSSISLSVWRDQIESILPKPNPNLSTSAQCAACLFSSHSLSFFHLSLWRPAATDRLSQDRPSTAAVAKISRVIVISDLLD